MPVFKNRESYRLLSFKLHQCRYKRQCIVEGNSKKRRLVSKDIMNIDKKLKTILQENNEPKESFRCIDIYTIVTFEIL